MWRKHAHGNLRRRGLTGKLSRHHDIVLCERWGVSTVLIGYFFQQEAGSVFCWGVPHFGLESVQLSIGMLRECKIKDSLTRFYYEKWQGKKCFTSISMTRYLYFTSFGMCFSFLSVQKRKFSCTYLRWGQMGCWGAARRTAWAWTGVGDHGRWRACQKLRLC